MKTTRTAAAVLVAMLSTSLPLPAFAQAQGTEDPVTTQARARFKEGVDFYDKGSYENARLAFLQAYALKKHPAVLLNLAQSSAKAGHALEASHYFQQYLKESTSASPQQRNDAEAGLAEVRQKLGRIEISAPAGTEVTLDEKERLGTAPFAEPVDVEPGQHSLRSSSDTVRVTAAAGQKVQAKLGATGAAAPPVAPVGPQPATDTPTEAPPPPPADSHHQDPLPMWPGYVGLGVAGAGLISTIVFAVFKADAQSKADAVASDIRSAAGSRAPGICTSTITADVTKYGGPCRTLKDNNDKVDTNAAIANVSAGVMIAGAIFGGVWLVAVPMVNRKRERENGGVTQGVLHDVKLTPYAGVGSGGFDFSARF